MTSPDRRFPFGHDPAPPRDTIEAPTRTTEPLPLPDPPRVTAPILGAASRKTLPFVSATMRGERALLPPPPRVRTLRLDHIAAVLACACAVAALLVVVLVCRGR